MFARDEHYAWFFEGPQWTLVLGAVGMVAVVLAGVMFPLWPVTLRIGVWYLSVGVLGLVALFFVIAIFRLIFWIVTRLTMKTAIWIYPNLFEDVGFVRSCLPLYGPTSAHRSHSSTPFDLSGRGICLQRRKSGR